MKSLQFTMRLCAGLLIVWFCIIFLRNRVYPYYDRDFRDAVAECSIRLSARNASRVLANTASSDPWLYVITPSATTLLQEPELLRLGQTLSLPPRIHWVIVTEFLKPPGRSSGKLGQNLLSPTLTAALDYTAVPYTVLEKPTSVLERTTHGRFSAGLDWVRSKAPLDAVVMFLEQSSTIDYSLLDQIRWTTSVSSWPLGLLDRYNTVTNPHDWTVLGSTKDVGAKSCDDLPTVELESLAVSISLLQTTQARLNKTSPCPAPHFLHQLLEGGTQYRILDSARQGQAYAWKTRTYIRKPSKILQILQSSNRGSNLDYLHDQLLIDLYKKSKKGKV